MLRGMVTPASGAGLTLQAAGLYWTLAFVAVCHVLAIQDRWRVPLPVRDLGFGAALTRALLLAFSATKAFIYFQF
jgi:hypothetical protein